MGVSVRQKNKGKGNPWWIFVTHQGQRKSISVGDKRAAENVAKGIREKLAGGKLNLNSEVSTFGEYSQKWLNNYVALECRESTFEDYDGILKNHILPVFKDKQINSITRGEIRDFLLSKVSGGLSRKRALVLKDVLSGAFNYALDDEVIETNPTTGITRRLWPKSNKPGAAVGQDAVFNEQEIEKLLAACAAECPEYYHFFLMACRTGLRLGECLALKWKDVDFKNNVLLVRRSYRRGRYTPPKNKKIRQVDMSGQVIETLKAMLPKDAAELVTMHNGIPIEQNNLRRIYKRILKRAALKHRKFHSLRHSYASMLLSKGVPVVYVKEQLGHSSIDITVDIYTHWISTDDNRHVNMLDSKHPSAPYTHPIKKEKIQPIEIMAKSL